MVDSDNNVGNIISTIGKVERMTFLGELRNSTKWTLKNINHKSTRLCLIVATNDEINRSAHRKREKIRKIHDLR